MIEVHRKPISFWRDGAHSESRSSVSQFSISIVSNPRDETELIFCIFEKSEKFLWRKISKVNSKDYRKIESILWDDLLSTKIYRLNGVVLKDSQRQQRHTDKKSKNKKVTLLSANEQPIWTIPRIFVKLVHSWTLYFSSQLLRWGDTRLVHGTNWSVAFCRNGRILYCIALQIFIVTSREVQIVNGSSFSAAVQLWSSCWIWKPNPRRLSNSVLSRVQVRFFAFSTHSSIFERQVRGRSSPEV